MVILLYVYQSPSHKRIIANTAGRTCVGLYPLWEGRHSMAHTAKSIYYDITGRGKLTPAVEQARVAGDDTTSQEEKIIVKS